MDDRDSRACSTSDAGARADLAGSTWDAIVVGAGFAGLYALHRLRGQGWRVKLVEAASDVGGTWYWNRYPGARCDVQSLVYCYSFDERLINEWKWSERYATQPEILRYFAFVADRLDLRRDILFETRVDAALFDEFRNEWRLRIDSAEVRSRFVIMATGAVSAGQLPDIPGIESFQGATYHTGSWPKEGVDFSGQRVAVIGTGSSGVQLIPLVAAEARQLTVFQRTPAFVAPARNTPLTELEMEQFRADFPAIRARMKRGEIVGTGDIMLTDHLPPPKLKMRQFNDDARQSLMQARWDVGGMAVAQTFADVMVDEEVNDTVAGFFRSKITEAVGSQELAARLTPTGFPIGSKRLCVGTDYLETFKRANVELVDVREAPIEAITPHSLHTADTTYEADAIIFATGFDAITGALLRIDIRGVDGRCLKDVWAAGPSAYLGLAIAGFPNLFAINGPGSPSVFGNVVVTIEHHVEWITDLLDHARANGVTRIEAEVEAQEQWAQHVTDLAAGTLFMRGNSWYLGANTPGKPRVFLIYAGGIAAYRDLCDEVAREDYRGFRLR